MAMMIAYFIIPMFCGKVFLEGDFVKKWVNKQTVISFILGAILFSGVGVGAASYYQFALSQNILYVDGAKVDKSLYIYQDTNYIPLRAAAETLGMDVDVEGKRIDLTSKPTGIEVVAKNADSCVLIRIYSTDNPSTAKFVGTASGVVIADGVIVTNKHVLDAGKMYGIQYNDTPAGINYKVTERYAVDTDLDIAFIKSPVRAKSASIGDSNKAKRGQEIAVISSPGGLKNQITEGYISGLSDDNDGQTIQINADINRGSSGGGLFDMSGDLIGINANMLADEKGYHYVIPINDITPLLGQIK